MIKPNQTTSVDGPAEEQGPLRSARIVNKKNKKVVPKPKPNVIRFYYVDRDAVCEDDYAEKIAMKCARPVERQLYDPELNKKVDHRRSIFDLVPVISR
ncbi:hypothetical protein HK098_007620 [Nowakowskiella sp. JEL0407]|nr:hypothetical protein HK098_007620 [Nowakowskiella sp. JEL0407]